LKLLRVICNLSQPYRLILHFFSFLWIKWKNDLPNVTL